MNILRKLIQWLALAKIEKWKQSDKDLTETMGTQGAERPGSYREQNPAGESYEGIKVTIPLPEDDK